MRRGFMFILAFALLALSGCGSRDDSVTGEIFHMKLAEEGFVVDDVTAGCGFAGILVKLCAVNGDGKYQINFLEFKNSTYAGSAYDVYSEYLKSLDSEKLESADGDLRTETQAKYCRALHCGNAVITAVVDRKYKKAVNAVFKMFS